MERQLHRSGQTHQDPQRGYFESVWLYEGETVENQETHCLRDGHRYQRILWFQL